MFDFLSVRKTAEAVNKKYRAQIQELDKITAQISAVTFAPTNRADICKIAVSWVDRSAVNFTDAVANRLRNNCTQGQVAPIDVGFFGLAKNEPGAGTPESLDTMMCGLFGNEIKRCLTDAIKAMPWENEGLPQAERAATLDTLRTREKELRSEIAELLKNADEAGLEIA